MGITGEYLIARTFGCWFDPRTFKGGDGHRKDLWRGNPGVEPTTISVKTRKQHLPADFLFPDGQSPEGFPDDYGIVARWTRPYTELQIEGYFDRADWFEHNTIIRATGVSEGKNPYRRGYPAEHLYDPMDLHMLLDMVEDEKICAVQSRGYFRCLGDWYNSRGDSVQRWDLCDPLAYEV